MSRKRFPAKNPRYEVIVGKDHAVGLFIQVFDEPDEEGYEVLIVDEDQLFTGLTPERAWEVLQEYAQVQDLSWEMIQKTL